MNDVENLMGMLERANIPFYHNEYEYTNVDEHGWVREQEQEVEMHTYDNYCTFYFTQDGKLKEVVNRVRVE